MRQIIISILVVINIFLIGLVKYLAFNDETIKSYGRLSNLSKEFREQKFDVVYKWVNMSDSIWRIREASYFNKPIPSEQELNEKDCPKCYSEIEFSIKYLFKYMGHMINTVYIVTQQQTPEFLIKSPNNRIQIINHSDIIPNEFLPCYNSNVIESFLYRIPNLSKWFISIDDDVFINKYITHDWFFLRDNIPRFIGKWMIPLCSILVKKLAKRGDDPWTRSILHTVMIYKNIENKKYFYPITLHVPKIINKLIYSKIMNNYYPIFKYYHSHVRSPTDINTMYLYQTYMVQNKLAMYSNDFTELYIPFGNNNKDNKKNYKKIIRSNPDFFVINDASHEADDQLITNECMESLIYWLDYNLIYK